MALGTQNTTSAANALRRLYPQPIVYEAVMAKLPTLAAMPKAGGAEGESLDITVVYGNPQGVSSQFSNAQSGTSTPLYARFNVKTGTTYGHGRISGPVLEKAASNKGAVIKELESGQKGLMETVKRHMSFFTFNNGGGAIGQVRSISTNTITLTRATDAVWFDIDQRVNLSLTDGTSGALKAGGPLVISGVTPRNSAGDCVLTFTTNVTATIGTAAANDFIFPDGNFGFTQTGEERNPVGILGWLTTPGGSDSFFGFNRSVHPTRLAGQLAQGITGSYKDQIKRALADFATLGCNPDTLIMNPLDVDDVTSNLGSLIRYDVRNTDVPRVNFRVVKFAAPGGDVDILPDPACPIGTVLAMQMDTWKLHYVGAGFPAYLERDGNLLRAVSNADAYEWRMGAYWAPVCYAPGKNGRILLTTN